MLNMIFLNHWHLILKNNNVNTKDKSQNVHKIKNRLKVYTCIVVGTISDPQLHVYYNNSKK